MAICCQTCHLVVSLNDKKLQDWPQYNCSPGLILTTMIFSKFMSGDVLLLCWTQSFKMVRKFWNGIYILRRVSFMASPISTHLWWPMLWTWELVMLALNFVMLMTSLKLFFISGENDMVVDTICNQLFEKIGTSMLRMKSVQIGINPLPPFGWDLALWTRALG